jgi:hypothetical protein
MVRVVARQANALPSLGDAPETPQSVFDPSRPLHSSRIISGLSYKTAFKSELWTSIVPL